MGFVGVLFTIAFYAVGIAIIATIVYYVIKKAVKAALVEWDEERKNEQ